MGRFDPADLKEVRRLTLRTVDAVGLNERDADRFVLAVSEAVSNMIVHTGGRGELRVYRDDGRLIADVESAGPGPALDGPAGRPDPARTDGRGLWLMHRCVDHIEVLAHAIGHRLRLIKTIVGALMTVTTIVAIGVA